MLFHYYSSNTSRRIVIDEKLLNHAPKTKVNIWIHHLIRVWPTEKQTLTTYLNSNKRCITYVLHIKYIGPVQKFFKLQKLTRLLVIILPYQVTKHFLSSHATQGKWLQRRFLPTRFCVVSSSNFCRDIGCCA